MRGCQFLPSQVPPLKVLIQLRFLRLQERQLPQSYVWYRARFDYLIIIEQGMAKHEEVFDCAQAAFTGNQG
jgi:hypothetical protein